MSIIETPDESEVTGPAADLYARNIRDQGFAAAHTRVLAVNPEALAAWSGLIGAIARSMDIRRYELVTLAAARGARSQHCRLAHGRKSLEYFDESQLEDIARDYRHADLTDAEVEMMAFAERVSTDSWAMTDADSLRLREAGFSDREIVDIALAAAARNFYSRAIQALAVPVEAPVDVSKPLRDALLADI